MQTRSIAVAFLVMGLAGCVNCPGPRRPDAGVDGGGGEALDAGPVRGGFAFGIEYADPGLASAYGAAGVKSMKTRLELFSWGKSEPTAPVGSAHSYDWSCTDAVIREYQAAGMTNVQSYLSPSSPWASKNLVAKDIMPKPEYLDDYELWLTALLERYDGDGKDDLPGLLAPVYLWVVAGEWTGFWGSGNADDYLQFLTVTHRAARAVNPRIQVGLIPFLLSDVFAGNPASQSQIDLKLKDPPPSFRNSTAGMMKILDRGDLYDYVDLHSLGAYTELPSTLAWFRSQLAARGLSKPLWIDDAFPIAWLANGVPNAKALYPVTDAQLPRVYDLLLQVADLQHAGNAVATAWLRALVAVGVVQKTVTAAGEGAAGIQLGNTQDWALDTQVEGLGGRKQSTYLIGAAAFMGLADATHPNGYEACRPVVQGAVRPALRNLELLASKVVGFELAEKLSGLGAGVWAWRFTRNGKTAIVAWHEDDVLQLPGELEVPVDVALPVGSASSVRVTYAVTDVAAPAPRVETVAAASGSVSLKLDSVPVFVEPL